MIRLTCANCQAQLEVEDAFAGGVCRCRHCGAIQTVPKASRPGTVTIGGTAGRGEEPKTLYQVKSRAGVASTPSGLEELAEVVHGSGLVGSGLLNRQTPRVVMPPGPPRKSNKAVWIGAGLGTLLGIALAVIGFISLRPAALTSTNGPAAAAGPTFAGVTLAGNKIVYVLDRGDATAAFFPALKDLTLKSVRGLGPDRLFQVILWDNGQSDAYPALSPGYATDAEVDKLARWLDQVATGRATDALPSLKMALTNSPDTVVLATAKSLQLDMSFIDAVLGLPHGRTAFDTFTLGDTGPDDPLRKIAQSTGGRFTAINAADLAASGN